MDTKAETRSQTKAKAQETSESAVTSPSSDTKPAPSGSSDTKPKGPLTINVKLHTTSFAMPTGSPATNKTGLGAATISTIPISPSPTVTSVPGGLPTPAPYIQFLQQPESQTK